MDGRKLAALLAFSALIASCGGGQTTIIQQQPPLPPPSLVSISITPKMPNIPQGTTLQMSAVGTYSDGSTKTLTTGVAWSSSDDTIATVSSSGLVTGVSVGSATITAAEGTVTGTTSTTVVLANVTAISVIPTTANATANGGFATFQSFATVSGDTTQVDVTTTTTWTITSTSSGTTADFSVTQGTDPVTVTVQSTATVGEVATITASYTSGTTTFTAVAKLTVD